MAARLRGRHQDEKIYYVYQFFLHGQCVYVGKGSGDRFKVQSRRFKDCSGEIVKHFNNEQEALTHELMLIKSLKPPYNKAAMPKEAMPWLKVILPEKDVDFKAWCLAIGNKQMAARIILAKDWKSLQKYNVDIKTLLSKLDPWCEVFNGVR